MQVAFGCAQLTIPMDMKLSKMHNKRIQSDSPLAVLRSC